MKNYDIKIVNKSAAEPSWDDFYVGRGSVLGNPCSNKPSSKAEFFVETREEAIEFYRNWLKQKVEEKDKAVCAALNTIVKILRKEGKINLLCWCVPLACHAEVIRDIVLEKLSNYPQ